MTNWERYFGTPDRAMCMEVRVTPWPLAIAVNEVDPHTGCAKSSRMVVRFASWDEYRAWLNAEHDAGTVWWEEDA